MNTLTVLLRAMITTKNLSRVKTSKLTSPANQKNMSSIMRNSKRSSESMLMQLVSTKNNLTHNGTRSLRNSRKLKMIRSKSKKNKRKERELRRREEELLRRKRKRDWKKRRKKESERRKKS